MAGTKSAFSQSIKRPLQWIAVSVILMAVVWIILSPLRTSVHSPVSSVTMQKVRSIGMLLYQYANDHHGVYPTGKSSTEVFQKLIDEQYVTDPSIFWEGSLHIPGKVKPTSNVLSPENVCWDVTVPVDEKSPDDLPVVFTTGYKIEYVAGGNAVPLFSSSEGRSEGIAVCYHSNSARYLPDDGLSNGTIAPIIDQDFNSAGKKYQQLTPDGPLGP
jgi:hypothetical protein